MPEKLYNEVLGATRTIESKARSRPTRWCSAKNSKSQYVARLIQSVSKLGAPEQRDLMKLFISSLFVGFKPTTANEHLGSLQKYLKLANLKFTERL